jgi:hypothetical protein
MNILNRIFLQLLELQLNSHQVTKPEVPKAGKAAQENEEPVKGVAENNLKQTEGSSDPSMAGVNANESTDEHIDAVCRHGESMQKDDAITVYICLEWIILLLKCQILLLCNLAPINWLNSLLEAHCHPVSPKM